MSWSLVRRVLLIVDGPVVRWSWLLSLESVNLACLSVCVYNMTKALALSQREQTCSTLRRIPIIVITVIIWPGVCLSKLIPFHQPDDLGFCLDMSYG